MSTRPDTLAPRPVRLDLAGVSLTGDLSVPASPRGLIVFAHGSGSSRHSHRNRSVAHVLQHGHFATLLIDLLSEEEDLVDAATSEYRFNIPLLANRLIAAVDWARNSAPVALLSIGLFGASTGAAAALIAAERRPAMIGAVVSRGGRTDLAQESLELVTAPTLFIVGGRDEVVIELNRKSLAHLKGPKEMEIVPGATHLFEEPGALEHVARSARDWFGRYLTS